MNSPFLKDQNQNQGLITLLTLRMVNTQNISIKLENIEVNDLTSIKVNTIEDAEQHVFDLISESNTMQFPNITTNELPNIIQRVVNQIAIKTRRGSANVLLINNNTFEIFKNLNNIVLLKQPTLVGRWLSVGKINGFIHIYVNDVIPDNSIYCLYSGSSTVDGIGVISENQNQLWYTPQPLTDITSPEKYIMNLQFSIV